MLKKSFIGLLLCVGFINASELKCDGIKCETKEKISFMGYKLYDIDYYLTKQEEKIKLTYDIEVEKEKNMKKILEKFKGNNKVSSQDQVKLDLWVSKTIDAVKGSTYEIIVSSDKSELKINGKKVISFNDNGDFGKKFLKIWSGSDPVDNDLKKSIEKARKILAFNS